MTIIINIEVLGADELSYDDEDRIAEAIADIVGADYELITVESELVDDGEEEEE